MHSVGNFKIKFHKCGRPSRTGRCPEQAAKSAIFYFDISVIYLQGFHIVKFVIIPPYFILQQYLWNIAIQPAVGCCAYKVIYFVFLLIARGKIIVIKDYCDNLCFPEFWKYTYIMMVIDMILEYIDTDTSRHWYTPTLCRMVWCRSNNWNPNNNKSCHPS